jgi:hypothetical protein
MTFLREKFDRPVVGGDGGRTPRKEEEGMTLVDRLVCNETQGIVVVECEEGATSSERMHMYT